jgi:hypothetical protein
MLRVYSPLMDRSGVSTTLPVAIPRRCFTPWSRPGIGRRPATPVQLVQRCRNLGRIVVPKGTKDLKISTSRQRRIERRTLDKASHPVEVGCRIVERASEHGPSAARAPDQAKRHPKRRALSRSVGSDEGGDHTPGNLGVQAINRVPTSVTLGESLDPNI